MITDKQTLKIMKSMPLHDSRVTEAKDILNNLLSELSKEQRIALVEEIGLSVVEWVEFDTDMPETIPIINRSILVDFEYEGLDGNKLNCTMETHLKDSGHFYGAPFGGIATAWMSLPQRKESK